MPLNRKIRNKIAILILILYACLSCLLGLYKEIRVFREPGRNNEIGVQDEKWIKLKPVLPQRGVIGYLSDSPSHMQFILVQYSLAPLILLNETSPEYVIGIFYDPKSISTMKPITLEIIHDYGDGLMILKNKKIQ